MRKTLPAGVVVIAATLTAVATSIAAPAFSQPGGCHTDPVGRCTQAPPEMQSPKYSPADEAAWGTTPDQHFAYYVTHDSSLPGFTIMDFDVMKGQALRACQKLTNGGDFIEVLREMPGRAN